MLVASRGGQGQMRAKLIDRARGCPQPLWAEFCILRARVGRRNRPQHLSPLSLVLDVDDDDNVVQTQNGCGRKRQMSLVARLHSQREKGGGREQPPHFVFLKLHARGT